MVSNPPKQPGLVPSFLKRKRARESSLSAEERTGEIKKAELVELVETTKRYHENLMNHRWELDSAVFHRNCLVTAKNGVSFNSPEKFFEVANQYNLKDFSSEEQMVLFTFDGGDHIDPWYLKANEIFVGFSTGPLRGCSHWVTTVLKEEREVFGIFEVETGQLFVDWNNRLVCELGLEDGGQ